MTDLPARISGEAWAAGGGEGYRVCTGRSAAECSMEHGTWMDILTELRVWP